MTYLICVDVGLIISTSVETAPAVPPTLASSMPVIPQPRGPFQWPNQLNSEKIVLSEIDQVVEKIIRDREKHGRLPRCCSTCGHFKTIGAFAPYHNIDQHLTECRVPADEIAPKQLQYQGWCMCERCNVFETSKIMEYFRINKIRRRPRYKEEAKSIHGSGEPKAKRTHDQKKLNK